MLKMYHRILIRRNCLAISAIYSEGQHNSQFLCTDTSLMQSLHTDNNMRKCRLLSEEISQNEFHKLLNYCML